MTRNSMWRLLLLGVLISALAAPVAHGKADPDEEEALRVIEARLREAQVQAPSAYPGRQAQPAAVPDIFGPGAVLTVGNIYMKVTNWAVIGNPFTNISTDPSAQWPAASGVEYLNFILLAVGAVNPTATDPTAKRRVSYIQEWWPPTPDPEDRMYRAYDGIISGGRLVDDDGDGLVDEDFLDGRDNDGDKRIDEDYAALGQLMYSCVMRDDTPAALAGAAAERHVPFGLEVRQTAWAYSVPGFTNFNVVQYDVYNRSGHTLDSLYFGLRVDIDAGPLASTTFFSDDQDLPFFPSGEFLVNVRPDDARFQEVLRASGRRDTLCPVRKIRVNGFSVVDDDGDEGRTQGVASFLLFGHTTDPLGKKAPSRVGFRAFRSFLAGTPFLSNGNPVTDQQRIEFMSSIQNIDPETGFINAEPGDQKGDYTAWSAVGPFLELPNDGMISATIGFAVDVGNHAKLLDYRLDYPRYQAGLMTLEDLFEKYPALKNAFEAQVAFEGVYELPRPAFVERVPNCHGCETGVKADPGTTFQLSETCPGRENPLKTVNEFAFTWFDFDCDLCTGVYNSDTKQGYFLRQWNAESPPPNPNLNVASTYNFTDNPGRVNPSGDGQITLAWDNLSEATPDPKTDEFDFRSYRVWKVAGWRRPVGSSGPNDEDWALLSELRLFDHADNNLRVDPDSGRAACPQVFIPNLSVQSLVFKKADFPLRQQAVAWACAEGYLECNRAVPVLCTNDPAVPDEPWLVRDEVVQGQGGSSEPVWRILLEVQRTTRPRCEGQVFDVEEGGAEKTCRPEALHSKDVAVGVRADICRLSNPRRSGVAVPICLNRGDFWDRQSGMVVRPDPSVDCVRDTLGNCEAKEGRQLSEETRVSKTRYRIGRYRLVDNEVKNGFSYFYSVTAGDSSIGGELHGRRAAVEADLVTPQVSTRATKGVWVVPNPYRGFRNIDARPSAWDLTPNATDPTGTHVDFLGLPPGRWTIRIFTVSGDLVAEIHHNDPVNESVRGPIKGDDGVVRQGFNRQQDHPGDGQARWNLISRNGQDVVSGIYLFVVDSDQGQDRGKFVVIR